MEKSRSVKSESQSDATACVASVMYFDEEIFPKNPSYILEKQMGQV